MKKISYENKAARQLVKIARKNPKIAELITEDVDKLAAWPDCPTLNYTNISGKSGFFRLKIRNYRAIFSPEGRVIIIYEVRKRNERTYK